MGLRDINRQDRYGCRVWREWSGNPDEMLSQHERMPDAREAYEAAKARWPDAVIVLCDGARIVARSCDEGERRDLTWCKANLPWFTL